MKRMTSKQSQIYRTDTILSIIASMRVTLYLIYHITDYLGKAGSFPISTILEYVVEIIILNNFNPNLIH